MTIKNARSITVSPAKALKGNLTVPGDKSISHRAVILGAISEGLTEVEGFLHGEDNLRTVDVFRAMGVNIHGVGDRLNIHGAGLKGLNEPDDVLYAGNSGTTARLMTGLLASMPFFSVITGDGSLRKRPMKRVIDPLTEMGAAIRGRHSNTLLPLAIEGGRLKGVKYSTPVASAQVKSSILLAGLGAVGPTTVTEPAKSRDHTERMLRAFGAEVKVDGNSVTLTPPERLHGARVDVPGDISSAAFFLVGGAVNPGSELLIKNVGVNPTRTGILKILEKMGASIDVTGQRETTGEPVADLLVRGTELTGVDISGAELLPAIDEFPAVCVAAAFAKGTTTVTGAEELKVKESDRIAAVASLLRAIGLDGVEERPDGIIIEGTGGESLPGGEVETFGDHRVAMAAAVAGTMTTGGVRIKDPKCADVSFPGFFSLLDAVRKDTPE